MSQTSKYKIAVMADVHANLPALQAVLEEIKQENCDQIYHLGDAVAIGPYPNECLELLLDQPNLELIMGNHDQWFAYGLPNPIPDWMSKGEIIHHEWLEGILDKKYKKIVAEFPYLIKKQYGQNKILFTHYGFEDYSKQFYRAIKQPKIKDLDEMFAQYQTDLVCFGHNHRPVDLAGRVRYINPGSLGCNPQQATARYIIIEGTQNRYQIINKEVAYDPSQLFKEFKVRQVPARRFICQTFYSADNN